MDKPNQKPPKKVKGRGIVLWIAFILLSLILFWVFRLQGSGPLAVNCPSQPEVLSDIAKPTATSSIGREVEYKIREYGAYIPRLLDREIDIAGDVYKLELSCKGNSISPYPNDSIPCQIVLLKNGRPTSEVPEALAQVAVGLPADYADNSGARGERALYPVLNILEGTGFERDKQQVNVANLIRGVPFITTDQPKPDRPSVEYPTAEILTLENGQANFTFHSGFSDQLPYTELLATIGSGSNKLVANKILCFGDTVAGDVDPGPTAHVTKGEFYYDVAINPTYAKHDGYEIAEIKVEARRSNGQIFTNPYQRVRLTFPFTSSYGTFLATTPDSTLRASAANGQTTDSDMVKLFIEQALTRTTSVHYDASFPSIAFDLINGRGTAYFLKLTSNQDLLRGVKRLARNVSAQTSLPYIVVQPFNYYPAEVSELGPVNRQDSIDRPFTLPVAGDNEAYRISHKISKPSPPDSENEWFMYGDKWLEQPFPDFFGAVAFPANPLANQVFTIAPLEYEAPKTGGGFPFYTIWIATLLLAQLVLEGLGISIWRIRKNRNAKSR